MSTKIITEIVESLKENFGAVKIYAGAVKIYAQNCLQAPAE